MNKLWSPWRSQYIESFKQKTQDTKCIFCYAAGLDVNDPDNLLVDKGEFTFSILNLYPYNNGHLMVVPYTHTDSFAALNKEEKAEIMEKLQLAELALRKVMSPEGYNIGANIGKVSGAGIDDHLHFHIVPRWNGDTNFMPVLGEVKVISQDLLITKQNIIKAIADLQHT
jgi:ATP adenylyltransferase